MSEVALRHEVFTAGSKAGPWESLGKLKQAAEGYVNEHALGPHVVNVSEAIYAWARPGAGVSRAFVTVWFRHPEEQPNPPRRDTYMPGGEDAGEEE